jgi:tartrate dehydrogenase/decarboxylase/D-malate dehydrogenase
MSYTIALTPGDGIGPEVVSATAPLLETAADSCGFEIETRTYEIGAARYLETGEVMADETLAALRDHDAILLGGVGLPEVDNAFVAAEGHHRIRRELDLWNNVRPAYLFDESVCPLKGYGQGDIDVLWFRENSEGEYIDAGGRLERRGATEMAMQCSVYTRDGIERIARAAFEAATDREGIVHNVTKSNVLSYGMTFWDEVVEEVAATYPDVRLEKLYVDAANLSIVSQPERYDVVVGPNLFSDILTDATAGVVGGLGLAPSANLNPDDDVPGMFEPVHGTAPDIAGEGIANPLATVLSAALLFENLGEHDAADALRSAVETQLGDDSAPRTPDLGGRATTEGVTADLNERLRGAN